MDASPTCVRHYTERNVMAETVICKCGSGPETRMGRAGQGRAGQHYLECRFLSTDAEHLTDEGDGYPMRY